MMDKFLIALKYGPNALELVKKLLKVKDWLVKKYKNRKERIEAEKKGNQTLVDKKKLEEEKAQKEVEGLTNDSVSVVFKFVPNEWKERATGEERSNFIKKVYKAVDSVIEAFEAGVALFHK